MRFDRVMIIGGPGSGKSWLAARLAGCLELPVIAIDEMIHDNDGRVRSAALIDKDALAASDRDFWIIEGGNTRTYERRLQRAQCLVRMKPARLTRLWRVARRDGMAWRLLRWTWQYDATFGPMDDAMVRAAHRRIPCFELKSRKDVRAFLEALPCPPGTPPSLIGKGQKPV